jgi:hypothetical protein
MDFLLHFADIDVRLSSPNQFNIWDVGMLMAFEDGIDLLKCSAFCLYPKYSLNR